MRAALLSIELENENEIIFETNDQLQYERSCSDANLSSLKLTGRANENMSVACIKGNEQEQGKINMDIKIIDIHQPPIHEQVRLN